MSNWKMKCISNEHNTSCYTVGKIYEVVDSKLKDDTGYEFGKVESFENWCDFSDSTWELIKDNFKVKCIKNWWGIMTKGKIYEFINGRSQLDSVTSNYYINYNDFKNRNTGGLDCIEEYKDHEFTLSDLEDGMKVTRRDGCSKVCDEDDIEHYRRDYREDLTYEDRFFNDYDIVKVEKVILEPLYIRKTKKVTLQEVYDKFGEEVEII